MGQPIQNHQSAGTDHAVRTAWGMERCAACLARCEIAVELNAADLDLLEVGNAGLTAAEQQTHFAFWAAAKWVARSPYAHT